MNKVTLILALTLLFSAWNVQAGEDNVMVINPIEVPPGKEAEALEIWDTYAAYFSKQPGYIGTKLHKSLDPKAKFHYINVAEWKTADDFVKALGNEELKQLGVSFPEDMPHYPSMYQIVRQ